MDNKDYNNINRDYPSNEYHNSDSTTNPMLPIISIFLIIAFSSLVFIIEDELSGKNRLKIFFEYLQNSIETTTKKEENTKNTNSNYYPLSNNTENSSENSENTSNNNESPIDDEKYSKLNSLSEDQLIKTISDENSQIILLTKLAIDKDFDNLLLELIKKYPSLTKDNVIDNETSLFYAAKKNSKKCIDILIKNGSDLNAENENGDTLLHIAAKKGNLQLAKKLLIAGIPVDKKNKDKLTPLYFAVIEKRYAMAAFLISCGANEKLIYEKNSKLYYSNLKRRTEDNNSSSLLYLKENKEWKEAYEYIKDGKLIDLFNLIKKGKDLSKMYYNDDPAPCIAANYGQYEILKMLLHEYDCKNLVNKKNGLNALHYAAKQSNEKIVDLLLQNGFDVNSTDFYNNTPLHFSVSNPLPFCTEYLLHHGADPDKVNLRKESPLHLAAQKGNVIAAKLFLKEGADINRQDYLGNTSLHYVAKYSSDSKMLDAFYKYRNKLNFTIKNIDGKTPKEMSSWDYFDYYEKHYLK